MRLNELLHSSSFVAKSANVLNWACLCKISPFLYLSGGLVTVSLLPYELRPIGRTVSFSFPGTMFVWVGRSGSDVGCWCICGMDLFVVIICALGLTYLLKCARVAARSTFPASLIMPKRSRARVCRRSSSFQVSSSSKRVEFFCRPSRWPLLKNFLSWCDAPGTLASL